MLLAESFFVIIVGGSGDHHAGDGALEAQVEVVRGADLFRRKAFGDQRLLALFGKLAQLSLKLDDRSRTQRLAGRRKLVLAHQIGHGHPISRQDAPMPMDEQRLDP